MALCLNRAPVCSKVYTVVRSRKLPLTHGAQGVRPSRSSRLGRAAGSAAEAVAEELLAEVELEAENGAAAKPCSMLLRRGRKRGKTVNTKESRTPRGPLCRGPRRARRGCFVRHAPPPAQPAPQHALFTSAAGVSNTGDGSGPAATEDVAAVADVSDVSSSSAPGLSPPRKLRNT